MAIAAAVPRKPVKSKRSIARKTRKPARSTKPRTTIVRPWEGREATGIADLRRLCRNSNRQSRSECRNSNRQSRSECRNSNRQSRSECRKPRAGVSRQGPTPFERRDTQYFILGDGRGRRALRALRLAAVIPASPIVTIDPVYAGRAYARPTGRVTYAGVAAEKYPLAWTRRSAAAQVVVLAFHAHTDVAAFVARLRRSLPKGVQVFVASVPCCRKGLRSPTRKLKHSGEEYQYVIPPASALPSKAEEATAGDPASDRRRSRAPRQKSSAKAKKIGAQHTATARDRPKRSARPRRERHG